MCSLDRFVFTCLHPRTERACSFDLPRVALLFTVPKGKAQDLRHFLVR